MKCVPPEFEYFWNALVHTLSSTITGLVLYTLYAVLFMFSIYTLIHRNPPGRRFLLLTASAMFLLGTSGTVVSVLMAGILFQSNKKLIEGSNDLARLIQVYVTLELIASILLVTSNFVADLVFLYRCYIIWGSKKRILILPGLSTLATLVVECISSVDSYNPTRVQKQYIDPRISFIMAAGTNVIFVCLTAGRIWYKRHEARIINCTTVRKRYETVIAMILESGAIYCLSMILQVISLSFIPTNLPYKTAELYNILAGVTNGLLTQAVNIAPTLILVRVGMDHVQWKQNATSRTHVPALSETSWRPRRFVLPLTDPSGTVVQIKQEDPSFEKSSVSSVVRK
ncbi:hypothetical protein FB451DRAFT_1257927 [Mycena latifolia]|nr:hypothetical protein FB451DRAFT_1257927 [Mycena latifolia]